MSSKDEKTNVLKDVSSGLGIFKEVLNENIGVDKISTMNEFVDSAPSTEDLQMQSVLYQSDLSVSNNNLDTESTPDLFFYSEYISSENSIPNSQSTNIFIGGADYDPNKNFDEEKHSVLSHHLGSDQNSGGSLDISSSKHTPVEIISSINNFDTRSNYTTLNASIYDELTPVFNFPEILEYKESAKSEANLCNGEKHEVINKYSTIDSQVDTDGAIDISNTSEGQQTETVEQAENISFKSDIDITLCRSLQIRDDSLIPEENIFQILENEPRNLVPKRTNVCNTPTNSDPLIGNPYSPLQTLFLDNRPNSIEHCSQNISSYIGLTPISPKTDIQKGECETVTPILMTTDAENKNGHCKEHTNSNDYFSSNSNDAKISETTESNFKKCPVCGDNATQHIHYGGSSCLSCRAFFRRTAKKYNGKDGFQYFCNCKEKCSERGQPVCVVSKTNRKSCKYCRYKKCHILAGMRNIHVLSMHISQKGTMKDTLKSNKKTKSSKFDSQKKGKKLRQYDNSKIQGMIYDMEKKFNPNFLNDIELIESIKRDINSNTRKLSVDKQYILDIALNQEVSLITRRFSDFIDMKTRVQLMRQNSTPLSKVLLVKMMHNFIAEDDSWNSDISSICHVLFSSCCRNKNTLNETERTCERIIKKMSELVDRGGKIFMFIFSIILFSSTVKSSSNNEKIAAHQLHFTQQTKQYLIFQAKGDQGLAAVRLGIAEEFIAKISE